MVELQYTSEHLILVRRLRGHAMQQHNSQQGWDMSCDDAVGPGEWQFSSLAYLWDPTRHAIMAGADRLERLPDPARAQSVSELTERVRVLMRDLDDGWLVSTAYFMVEDLYKSCFYEFRWSAGVEQYIAATAAGFTHELTRRGYVLHYVIDNTEIEGRLAASLSNVSAVFATAGLVVASPQLMGLELMERADHQPREVTALARYRDEGHFVANNLVTHCHSERRHSLYLNLDLDDGLPGVALDVAMSQEGSPGTIVVLRNLPPHIGSFAQIAPPPGITLPRSATT